MVSAPTARPDGTGVILVVNGDEHRIARRDAQALLRELTRSIVEAEPPKPDAIAERSTLAA
jgi:hypothetical protein